MRRHRILTLVLALFIPVLVLAQGAVQPRVFIPFKATGSGSSITTPVSVANGGTGNANGDGLLATCTDSVGTDAFACSSTSTPGCPASLAASEPVLFVAGTANTGAATFDYCALGAKALVKTVGGISTALSTGDILAKQPVLAVYNATDDDWKMISAVSTASGSGSPGGSNTQVQFNDSSAFGGDAGLVYNKTTDTLTSGLIAISSSAAAANLTLSGSAQGLRVNSTLFEWYTGSGTNRSMALGSSASGGSVTLSANYCSAWTNGNNDPNTTGDSFFCRNSAGVVRFGTSTTAINGLIGGGSAVASATALPLPTGRVFHVTGTTTVTSITSTNFASGAVITLIFDGILTFTDGSNLKLAGNFVTSADATITLVFDGTNWFETSRSTN